MVVYAPVAAGLTKNHTPSELTPGDAYLVRFKNSQNGYRTDLWIGIILTEDFGPGRYLHGRHKNAKQADGTWPAPLNERAYPVYMPGKNSFRWVRINDIFNLGHQVPAQFSRSSTRADAELFRNLQKIALQKPDCLFWEAMAEKEVRMKGKKCRTPELVLPDECEDILLGLPDLEEDGCLGGPVELDATPAPGPSHAGSSILSQPSSSQSIEGKAIAAQATLDGGNAYQLLNFPGESSTFRDYASGGQPFSDGAQASSSSSHPITENQIASPSSSHSVHVKAEPTSTASTPLKPAKVRSPKGKAPMRPAKRTRRSIYSVTITELLHKTFHESPDADELCDIVTAMLEVRQRPEASKIRSFDITGEFEPRIVQILNQSTESTSDTQSEEPQIGDITHLNRNYRLEGITDSKTLQQEIIALGTFYRYARRFNKPALVEKITTKLQIAWNSYPGLSQLDPILDVAKIAFQDGIEKIDVLQEWILMFIADTKDLFPVACNTKYWDVMRSFPVLMEAVNARRDELLRVDPGKYSDVRVLLRERGFENF